MSKVLGTIWVCDDCMHAAEYGECGPDRPEDLPEPLSAIREGCRVTLGMGHEEHHEDCPVRITGDHNAAECDCEYDNFGTGSCEGCGDSLAGERHAMTLWLEKHIVTEESYGAGTVRRAVCSCGDVSFPIGDGVTLAEVASGHAVDGVLVDELSWGHAF